MIKNSKKKYELLNDSGIKHANKGELNKAEHCFLKAINLNSNEYKAYINLSNIYVLKKQKKNCTELLIDYLLKNKFNEYIANHAGNLFYNFEYDNELKRLFEITKLNIKNIKKDKYYLFYIQGKFFEKKEDFNKSKKAYSNSILCNKHFFRSYVRLLSLLEKTNNLNDIDLLLKEGLKNFKDIDQQNILILYKSIYLNRIKNYIESQKLIQKNNLEVKLAKNIPFFITLLDLESKNFDKLKDFKTAFKKVEARNKLKSNLEENKKFNGLNIYDSISKYKKFYIKKNIKLIERNLKYHDDTNLVFLVGFPRSGTTLLDSILRSHSKIKVLEEKPYILNLRHKFFEKKNNDLTSLLGITQKEKDIIRQEYFKYIFKNSKDKQKVIIDKFPLSIIEIGFIKCIFPKAKIILAMRHPCDVVISCFFSSFKINDAMVNFLKWDDTIAFYNEVFELFEFYTEELSLQYFTIRYEDIINDFKNQISNLTKFLDVEFENKMNKFYITAKKRVKISTPSYSQVINPLYTSSIDRWKNYDQSLRSNKYLNKWIKKFNY